MTAPDDRPGKQHDPPAPDSRETDEAVPPTPPAEGTSRSAGSGTERVVFWVSMVVGVAIVVFALNGLRTARLIDRPMFSDGSIVFGTFAKFFVISAVLIDVVLIPLAAGIGYVAKRLVPAKAWPVVRAGLLATGTLLLYSYALVFDKGGKPGLPSLRPRDYHAGLLWALVVTWAIAAVAFAVMYLLAQRRGPDPTGD